MTDVTRAASPDRSNREWRNQAAFAALTESGEIRAWGNPSSGGLLSAEASGLKGVKQIYSSSSAFAALTDQGRVVAWGAMVVMRAPFLLSCRVEYVPFLRRRKLLRLWMYMVE